MSEDGEETRKRKAAVEELTPAQLGHITSVADLPIPSALTKFLKSPERKPKDEQDGRYFFQSQILRTVQ